MPTDPLPDPGSSAQVRQWLAEFEVRAARGEMVDLEALCRQHPEHAAELRRLKSDLDWLRSAVQRNDRGPRERAPLADELRSRFGGDVDPAVSLGGAAPASDSGPSSELLKRLRTHAPASSRYRLLGEVGRGGMGAVLKIWDEDLRRTLAMKVVLGKEDAAKPGNTPPVDSRTLGRFLEEAQVTGQLDHPGIVPVHELGLGSDGRVYFTMRLVKGEDLRKIYEYVESGHEGWNPTRALGVLLKVCEAMSYAHDKGVVHRDLKPANVMVGKYGEVYVMDWGLARVMGQADRHDLRLRPEPPMTGSVRTERKEERTEGSDSPLVTMDGDVMGTPTYMPPEQARGELEKLGPHSDVYAVGAMLYHLLTGETPFVPKGVRASPRAVLMRLLEGPPRPLIELAPRVPAELVAICEKAMERDIPRRYPSMLALADDLRAYLERRVVKAYESGTWAETRKWVLRNKPLAGSLAAAVVIAITGIVWVGAKNRQIQATNVDLVVARQEADDKSKEASAQSKLAGERAREAQENAQRAEDASKEALASAERANRLKDEAILRDRESRLRALLPDLALFDTLDDDLTYARRQSRPASEWWLERAHELVDGVEDDPAKGRSWTPGLRDVEDALVKVRARALDRAPADVAKDLESNPKAKELVAMRSKLLWCSRMQGASPWPKESDVEASLSESERQGDARHLMALVMQLTNMSPDTLEAQDHGDEVKAVVLARRALTAATSREEPGCRGLLAVALLNAGDFDESIAIARAAGPKVNDIGHDRHLVTELEKAAASWRDGNARTTRRREHDALEADVKALETVLTDALGWTFADGLDDWWHAQLVQLRDDLRRLRFTLLDAERSVRGPDASRAWQLATNGVAAMPQYGGLILTPQLGLLPIGPDPRSKLWEFVDVRTGEAPSRGVDGQLMLTPNMGIVFVLLPGGRLPAEAGKQPSSLNRVDLDPFFLSKYEMTGEQWARVEPSKANTLKGGPAMLPAFGGSWDDCADAMRRIGLWTRLPTEAQWQYGCRAGTTSAWWTGNTPETLFDAANLEFHAGPMSGFEHAQQEDEKTRTGQRLDRPPSGLEPIGRRRANPFGLHDVHGNVREWCTTSFGPDFGLARRGDGERTLVTQPHTHLSLGGGFKSTTDDALTSMRQYGNLRDMDSINEEQGLRPARSLTP